MLRSQQSRFSLILSIALVAIGSEVEAGFVTYTTSTPSTPTNFVQALTVPSFNASKYGTLESVVISYTDLLKINGSIVNNSAKAQTFTFNEIVNFSLSLGGTKLLSDESSAAIGSTTVQGRGGVLTVGTFNVTNGAGVSTISSSNSLIKDFTGLTAPVFSFAAVGSTIINGEGGNDSTNINTVADASVTVTYNYAPNAVPEPASLVMIVLGGLLVAGTGYARNRARTKAAAGR